VTLPGRHQCLQQSPLAKLSSHGIEPILTNLDGWTVAEGSPRMTTWIEYKAPDGSAIAGTWEATPGTFRAEYRAPEFVHLREGTIEITPDGGETVTVTAGDAFCVEADFAGLWKIVAPVRKHFLIILGQ